MDLFKIVIPKDIDNVNERKWWIYIQKFRASISYLIVIHIFIREMYIIHNQRNIGSTKIIRRSC